MFGFGKKEATSKVVAAKKPVEVEFGMQACKGCGGHVKGCKLTDDQLLKELGFEPNHPKRKNILVDARKDLG